MTNTKAHVINDAKVNLFQLKVVCSLFLFFSFEGGGVLHFAQKNTTEKRSK